MTRPRAQGRSSFNNWTTYSGVTLEQERGITISNSHTAVHLLYTSLLKKTKQKYLVTRNSHSHRKQIKCCATAKLTNGIQSRIHNGRLKATVQLTCNICRNFV